MQHQEWRMRCRSQKEGHDNCNGHLHDCGHASLECWLKWISAYLQEKGNDNELQEIDLGSGQGGGASITERSDW